MAAAPIGIVGLGPTTSAMARRLASGGRRVLVHDRQPERRAMLAGLRPGIEIAGSLADIGAECSDVVLWRPSPEALVSELFGDPDRPGLAHELSPGALVIDLSPGSPSLPPRLQGALGQRAIAIVDAAVLAGDIDDAGAAALDFALGGYAEFVARAEAVLAPLGRVHRTGQLGTARAAGTIARALRAVLRKAVIEAGELGRAAGLAPDTVLTAIALARREWDDRSLDAAALAVDAAPAVELASELGLAAPLAECTTR